MFHLRFFSRCSEFNLKLNPASKLSFKSEVEFLGSELSDIRIRPTESKLKTVKKICCLMTRQTNHMITYHMF